MVVLRKCCCFGLKTGSLIICYIVLTENLLSFLGAVVNSNDVSTAKSIISSRHESSSARFFNLCITVFNIMIDCIAIFGIYKQRPSLLIPFLAYRTVNLIFMLFTLLNSRNIADALAEEVEKQVDESSSNEDLPDLLPQVIILVMLITVWELYCLLVVYSFYQVLCQNIRMIAVSVPIVTYSVQPPETYTQPPLNPYIFQAPKYPYQYENSKYSYNTNVPSSPNQLPPPYGT